MKAFLSLAFICIALTANAFVFPSINQKDIKQSSRTANGLQFTEYEAVSGIIRGFLKTLNVDHPVDSVYCYNQDSAIAVYNFIQGAALVSATTSRSTLPIAIGEYLGTVGNRIYEKTSEATLNCLANSKDFKKVIDALGTNPTSDAFVTAFVKTIAQQTGLFQATYNIVYQSLNEGNFEDAGRTLATFQKIVAQKFKNNKI